MVKENIVIVGSGGAGVLLASQLSSRVDSSNHNIVLISPGGRHFVMPSLIRMVVTDDGHLEERAALPLSEMFTGRVEVKIGKVVGIEDDGELGTGGSVTLESGEQVSYKVLVLATGSSFEGPLAFPDAYADVLDYVKQWRSKFAKANHVAIVGAGSVGLEFAGEIKDYYPNTKVTVIHAGVLPLSSAYPHKLRKKVLKRWEARGVQFILDDKVDDTKAATTVGVQTSKGKQVDADLVILARGPRPNTQYLNSLGGDVLDKEDRVKVLQTLQVEGHPDIFAAGDILSFKEQKQLAKVAGHVATIVPNILALLKGNDPVDLYKGTFELIGITNGKRGGILYVGLLWGIILGDMVVRALKSNDLFVSTTRKAYGFNV